MALWIDLFFRTEIHRVVLIFNGALLVAPADTSGCSKPRGSRHRDWPVEAPVLSGINLNGGKSPPIDYMSSVVVPSSIKEIDRHLQLHSIL